jgi:CheY-like chemotaxis protein
MEEEILKGKTLLVVDDETDLRDIVASELEFMGAKVFQAENILTAKDLLKKHSIDLIVSDIRMPGGTGIDLLNYLKAIDVHRPPIILITGFADITVEEAHALGAEAIMNKPFKLDDLIATVAKFTMDPSYRFQQSPKSVGQTLSHNFPTSFGTGSSDFKLGRGGMVVRFASIGIRLEPGQLVDFRFSFSDFLLEGQGTIRWLKILESPSKMEAGFEFTTLHGESLKKIIKFLEEKSEVSFIPRL